MQYGTRPVALVEALKDADDAFSSTRYSYQEVQYCSCDVFSYCGRYSYSYEYAEDVVVKYAYEYSKDSYFPRPVRVPVK